MVLIDGYIVWIFSAVLPNVTARFWQEISKVERINENALGIGIGILKRINDHLRCSVLGVLGEWGTGPNRRRMGCLIVGDHSQMPAVVQVV